MKKREILLLVLLVLVFCTGIVSWVGASVAKASNKVFQKKSKGAIITDTVDLTEFKRIDLDVSSINAYIEPGDGYKLEYRAYKDNLPEIQEHNGKLVVKQPTHFRVRFIMFSNMFDNDEEFYKITVPKNSGLIDVDLNASSGRISVGNVDINGRIDISSGNIDLENITSEKLRLDATSGDIDIKNVELDELSVDITSGNLDASRCTTDELECKLTSGRMDFEELKVNKVDFDMTSGDADLEIVGKEDDYSYDLDATSGSFKLNGKRINDSYKTDGSKDKEIKAEMTSGSMSISFKD